MKTKNKVLVSVLILFGLALNIIYINNLNVDLIQAQADGPDITLSGKLEILIDDNFSGSEQIPNEYYIVATNGSKQKIAPENEADLYPNSFITITGKEVVGSIKGTVVTNSIIETPLTPEIEDTPEFKGTPYDILVFLIKPKTGGNPAPFSQTEASSIINQGPFAKFIKENSFNKRFVKATVYDWIPVDSCLQSGFSDQDVVDFINQNSIPLGSFKHVFFLRNCGLNNGYSSIGPSSAVVNGINYIFSIASVTMESDILSPSEFAIGYPQPFPWSTLDHIMIHEFGHGLGLTHSNGLQCDDGNAPISDSCFPIERGNTFDTMGKGTGHALHFNASQKEKVGWIKGLNITTSGTYTVHQLEPGGTSKIVLLKIKNPSIPNSVINYSVENRRGVLYDSALSAYPVLSGNQNGIFIMRDSGGGETRLIDTKPIPLGTDWFSAIRDGALTGADVFSDPSTGITIGPIVSTTNSSVTFNVGIEAVPACTNNNPIIQTFEPYTYNPNVGPNSLSLLVAVRNADVISCTPSNFKIDLVPVDLNTNTLSITKNLIPKEFYPGNHTSFYGPFIPAGTPAGNYAFNIVATNLDVPGFQTTKTINITVP